MKNENLAYAMTDIDEKFIEEAHARTEKAPRRWVKYLAPVAACFCLIALCVFIPLQLLQSSKGGVSWSGENIAEMPSDAPGNTQDNASSQISGSDSQESECFIGNTLTSEYGSVTFVAETETTVTLTIVKSSDETWNITFFGNKAGERVVATNDADYYGDRVISDAFTVTVNGVLSPDAALPEKAGEYEVTIDFSSMAETDVHFTEFSVSGFSSFFLRILCS